MSPEDLETAILIALNPCQCHVWRSLTQKSGANGVKCSVTRVGVVVGLGSYWHDRHYI